MKEDNKSKVSQGRKSRRKGARVENEIVKRCVNAGIPATKVSRSGYDGVDLFIDGRNAEVKARKDGQGFVTLEKWLGENDLLILRRDNKEPMVVMPWEVFVQISNSETGNE